MPVGRNPSRQGKSSEENEAVYTYSEPTASPDNAVLRILYNQHRVAEGKEAILFLYCFLVGVHNVFLACEGADEHY